MRPCLRRSQPGACGTQRRVGSCRFGLRFLHFALGSDLLCREPLLARQCLVREVGAGARAKVPGTGLTQFDAL